MQTNGLTNQSPPTVAVIGAGISGLTCARTLADQGVPVTVFEKSRGVGGRMATRRSEHGVAFDHGAQYFTVRDERFRSSVDSWLHDGLVRPWTGRIVSLCDQHAEQDKTSTPRFVACPGMNAICKRLAEDLEVHTRTPVTPPVRRRSKWLVSDEAGSELGQYDIAIISAPGPQAGTLLQESPHLARLASSVRIAGCWALLVQFPARIDVDYDGAFVQASPLSWVARNSSKPGRTPDTETWILHASGDWTQRHLEETPEAIREQLLDAFWDATGLAVVPPGDVVAHRWRYALPTEPLPDRCLFDGDLKIGACGDWCAGPRVEGAFLSGAAMAGRVLALLGHVDCEA
jgi:predicted NAD/FAD-dependent oxidoreductase